MNNNLILKRCNKCGALIEVLKDCQCKDCGIMCCNEKMQEVTLNNEEASFEKHIPHYELKDDELIININHVMEPDHYIEWISVQTEQESYRRYFKPNETPTIKFKITSPAVIYSYCNKHGLWKNEVKEII